MAGLSHYIYSHLPIPFQSVVVNIYGLYWYHLRFGGDFQEQKKNFRARDFYTLAQWQEYQNNALRTLFKMAAEAPYYARTFSEANINLERLEEIDIAILKRLPLLSKEAIRKNPQDFLRKRTPKLYREYTSGTTGTPLEIRFSAATYKKISAAYEVRCRNWAGVDYRMSRAMIGGRLIVPKAESKPPFWRYNVAERQLYLSAFHISPQNARFYAEALNHYRPDYLVGYTVSHYLLARMFKEQNLSLYKPKAILTSSEKLTEEMRDVLQSVYRCEVYDAYSGVEACCLASECEYHRLHVSPDVGIIELLGEDGRPVKHGEVGELVTTGLLNFDQPLIRYRTGDYAVLAEESCPCGRQMPVLKELVGRLEDVVIGPDGRQMVRFHGIFIGLPHLREGQVVQETLTDFRVRLVVEEGFSEHDVSIIKNRFYERLGKVNVIIEYLDNIERTERGKFRSVISNITKNNYAK